MSGGAGREERSLGNTAAGYTPAVGRKAIFKEKAGRQGKGTKILSKREADSDEASCGQDIKGA